MTLAACEAFAEVDVLRGEPMDGMGTVKAGTSSTLLGSYRVAKETVETGTVMLRLRYDSAESTEPLKTANIESGA